MAVFPSSHLSTLLCLSTIIFFALLSLSVFPSLFFYPSSSSSFSPALWLFFKRSYDNSPGCMPFTSPLSTQIHWRKALGVHNHADTQQEISKYVLYQMAPAHKYSSCMCCAPAYSLICLCQYTVHMLKLRAHTYTAQLTSVDKNRHSI